MGFCRCFKEFLGKCTTYFTCWNLYWIDRSYFSGYGQELVGVEQSGIWYAITEDPDDLESSFDPVFNNRQYLEYSDGDEIRIEGKLTSIRYFGDIEDGLYPIPPDGLTPLL